MGARVCIVLIQSVLITGLFAAGCEVGPGGEANIEAALQAPAQTPPPAVHRIDGHPGPSAPASACPPGQVRKAEPSPEWADLVAHTRGMIAQGRFTEARTEVLSALDSRPGNHRLLYLLSILELADENYESVVDLSGGALEKDPNALPFLETRAVASLLMSDLDQAQRDLLGLLDRLELVSRERGEAFCNPLSECCEAADVKMASVTASLATVYYNFGDLDEAERLATTVLNAFPNAPEAWFALGLVRNKHDDIRGSLDAYRQVLTVQPGNPSALNNVGVLRYRLRDLTNAERLFRAAGTNYGIDRRGVALTLSNIAELRMLQARYRESEDLYMQSRHLSNREPAPHYGIAALYDVLGRQAESLDAMRQALAMDARGLTRYNSEHIDPEWAWQEEALVAEAQGRARDAAPFWCRILGGNVDVLRASAWRHLGGTTAACSLRGDVEDRAPRPTRVDGVVPRNQTTDSPIHPIPR